MNVSDYWVARSSRAMTAESVARHGFTFRTAKFVIASFCEAIHAASKEWIASSRELLAMTARDGFDGHTHIRGIARLHNGPSYPRMRVSSNTRRRGLIMNVSDYWGARSSRAMTAE
jgi:hypothetical protein